MKDLSKLIDLMFRPDDTICLSNSQWAYHSMPIPYVLDGEVVLVSPSSKVPNKTVNTKDLVLMSINPIKGFRKDSGVYRHQNYLFEIDTGSLASQMAWTKKLGLPYSAAVFSGSKSLHFLLALEEELDAKTYLFLYEWALAIGNFFDPACKNPSRCIRIPGAIRPETGKEQKLVEIGNKVKLADFRSWLEKHPDSMPKPKERKKTSSYKGFDKLSFWAVKQLKDGIDFTKGRNRAYFALACDIYRTGYSEDDAAEILLLNFNEESDFKEKELLTTISSAYKYMENK